MKWAERDQEIEKYAEDVCNEYKDKAGIVLFGAGNIGIRIRRTLISFGMFAGFVDNSAEKRNKGYEGEAIHSPDFVLTDNYFVVVSVGNQFYYEISKQLIMMGLIEHKDFISSDEFENRWFPVFSYFNLHMLYTNIAQICVTERCTLHCKKCAHACNYVDIKKDDKNIEYMKESADTFFSKYNKVGEFVIIGGEPLLYKDLPELVEYIGERYRSQIILFTITTNGTILPSAELLEQCEKYSVTIRVSDYASTLPYLTNNYEKFYEKTKKLNVLIWKTDNQSSWFDYGFDEEIYKTNVEAQKTFMECHTQCREISGNKYYYCVMAHTVAANLGICAGESDYIIINEDTSQKELLEFELGYNEKGFLDMCKRCRGKDAEKFLIPAAEQV